MTYEELERHHYITGSPLQPLYSALYDLERENIQHQWNIDDLEERISELEQELWSKNNE